MHPSPEYKLTFDNREGYLQATVQAKTIDRETALDYLSEMANKCRQLEYDRLLVVRDIPSMVDLGSLFSIAENFPDLMQGIKVAVVNPFAEIRKDMDLAVLMATNRGAQFTVHNSIPEAENWLLR